MKLVPCSSTKQKLLWIMWIRELIRALPGKTRANARKLLVPVLIFRLHTHWRVSGRLLSFNKITNAVQG